MPIQPLAARRWTPARHTAGRWLVAVFALLLSGCDALRPFDPAVNSSAAARPTPHIAAPRPGVDDHKPWPWDGFTAGPLYKDLRTYNGGRIITAAGPLFRYEVREDGARRVYIPGLLTHGEANNRATRHRDSAGRLLWPLFSWKSTANETVFVQYPLIWIKKRIRRQGEGRAPLENLDIKLAGGIINLNIDSERGVTGGVLPLFGVFHHLFARETVTFYAPFICKTEGGGLTAWHYPWPLIGHWTREDGKREGYRVFPFYSIDDHKGVWFKRTILWPFWNEYHSQLDTKYPMRSWSLFPIYTRRISPRREQHNVLLLFNYYKRLASNGTSAEPGSAAIPTNEAFVSYSIWPFFNYERGDGRSAISIWPLFKYRNTPRLKQIGRANV